MSKSLKRGGKYQNKSSANYYGSIGEIVVYDRVLTDDEIEEIKTYFNNKWSIY